MVDALNTTFKKYIKEASGFPTGPVGENPNNVGGSLDVLNLSVLPVLKEASELGIKVNLIYTAILEQLTSS